MKRFLSLFFTLVVLIGVTETTVKASAKDAAAASSKSAAAPKPKFFGLFSRHTADGDAEKDDESPSKLASATRRWHPFRKKELTAEEEAIADEKRDRKHHSSLFVENKEYARALTAYERSSNSIRFTTPVTSDMLVAHLVAIAQFEDVINTLSDKESLIARHKYRLLLESRAEAKALLAETLAAEEAMLKGAPVVVVPMPTNRAQALKLLGFSKTDMPGKEAIRPAFVQLFKQYEGNADAQRALLAARKLLIPD